MPWHPARPAGSPPRWRAVTEESVPQVRPFRALRFRPEAVGDLALVLSPPYDVVSPEEQRRLLARHPRNVVRLDLPETEAGDEPDERYRRAARTLAEWRSDGTLHKDPRPSIYVYEQWFTVPGSGVDRVQRGFFGRLRLEAFGEGSVLPHERTLDAPKEDRYRLLRATGVNTSPVVGLYADRSGEAARLLEAVAATPPDIEVRDADGVRHRLWALPDDAEHSGPAARLAGLAGAGPITIADGHHRYETALRYRDERRMARSCEEDPPFDYLLVLFLDAASEALTVLPTHRLVRGPADADVRRALATLFDVEVASRERLIDAFDAAAGPGGRGRFGLWTRSGGALLTARRAAFERFLPPGGGALRGLDVTLLGIALEQLFGIDAEAVGAGDRVGYTKSAGEAIALVDRGMDDPTAADVAFLLEPTPVSSILAVAADGDVMPQKSTYFYPKPPSGLLINPHEW
jgi:uncharacterized protein (DUF1015 family)